MTSTLLPRVTDVIVSNDYNLIISFADKSIKKYNCENLLNFGIFKEFQDENYFQKAFTEDGTVRWPNGQDICPDTLYIDSVMV